MIAGTDRDLLGHILDTGERIRLFLDGMDSQAFEKDIKTQDAVIRNLEVIGEAVSRLSPSLRAAHPDIPWGLAIATRNRLIHGYFAVTIAIVWLTATRDIPALTDRIRGVLDIET